MMTVIVTACSAFGLTVSEAKAEISACRPIWAECVVHHHCSQPGVQKNDRISVLMRGYQHG